MQHTNDDIDDLFRNAADSYPLKIKGADWDSVAGRLLNDDGDGTISPVLPLSSSKSKRNYKYLLLLLLIPIGFLTAKYAGWTGGGGNETQKAVANTSKTVPAVTQTQAVKTPVITTPAPAANAANSNANAGSTAAAGTKPVTVTRKANSNAVMANGTVGKNDANAGESKNVPQASALYQLREIDQQRANMPIAETPANVLPQANTATQPAVVPNSSMAETKPASNELQQQQPGAELLKPQQQDAGTTQDVAAIPGSGKNGGEGGKKSVAITHNKPVYIGAFVAPDYTTVKYQPGNKVGFDFGGIVGYTVSKNLSVELGISLDKKYYTSDGKYYNSNQKWIQNAGTLLNLSGYSSLTEIPLNVHYSFKPGRDGNFFVSGGLVSYIVHEENYDYEFDKNGYIYHRDKASKNSTNNFFTNFNISAGYESSLGNNCSFRVEPYYRIPVKGIGFNSSFACVGLNFNFIFNYFPFIIRLTKIFGYPVKISYFQNGRGSCKWNFINEIVYNARKL
jgi:hypothetical protein